MRNAGWKRLLAVVLVLMMTLSLMPAAFADGDVECTMGEGCPATVHNEGCPAAPKVEVEEVVVTCTGAEGCPATVHNAGCPAAPKVEVEEVVVTCTGAEGCPATVHNEGCPAAPKVEVEEVKTCTGAADCPATVHSEGCLAVKKTEVEEVVVTCTGAADCTATVHSEGCLAVKKTEVEDEDKDEDEVKACAITEGCTLAAGHEGDCVLKEKEDGDEDEVKACAITEGCTLAAGHEGDCVLKEKEDEDEVEACTLTEGCTLAAGHEGDCVLKEKEDEDEDDEPSAAVQAFLDAVAAIVIPENPEEMDEDSYAALEAQIEVAYDALEALSDEELEREDVLAACAIMSAAMDILYGEREDWANVKGEQFTINVVAVYKNGTVINSTTLTTTCKDSTAHSGYNHSINLKEFHPSTLGWTTTGWAGWCRPQSTVYTGQALYGTFYSWDKTSTSIHYNITGTPPYKAAETIFLVYDNPAPVTYSYKVNHVYRTNGVQDGIFTQTIPNVTAGTTVRLGSITQQPVYNSKTYTYTDGSPDSAIIKDDSTVFTLYYDRTEKPADSVVENLLANGAVTVDCVNDTAGHADKTYGLLTGSYNIGDVTGDAEHGYNCTITVSADPYVSAYSKDVSLEHTLDDAESKTITLNFNASSKTWTVASGAAPVTFKVKCVTPPAPTQPAKPTENELNNLQAVTIDCVNDTAGHANETYSLIVGSYTLGDVTWDATNSCYQCSVTVNDPTNYVNQYNVKHSGHSLDPEVQPPKTITLNYVDKAWTVVAGTAVTFTVKCVTPPAPSSKPDAPSKEKLEADADLKVAVQCVNGEATHKDKIKDYGLLPDSYQIGEVTGDATSGYFCEVTVNAAPYVDKYNSDVASGHGLVTDDPNSQKFTLKYNATDSTWSRPNPDGPAATFRVECEDAEIVPPVKPTNNAVKTLLGEAAVTIDCVNTGVSHGDETYGLIDGSFTVGNVEENATGLFTCTVTIQAAEYVTAYNSDVAPGHSLATGETPSKTVTLEYDADEKEWSVVPANAVPVVFRVVCGASQPATDWSKLTITKTVSPTGTVMPGDTVTYTITVTNNTGKLLSNITVSETLDRTKLESFVASADMDYDFTSGTWRIWALANGSSATLTISAKVKADATGTINNTATITGAGDGGNRLPQGSGGSSSVSITVGTPAPMNKFTLSYNANGGKGAPSSQSVETTAKIVVMTVSSVQPTRDGYHFCGWALTPNGHVSYRPGNEITLTGDVTLYAVWATPTSSPQTGDSSNVALWAAMAGMSLAAGAVVLFVLKKRKAE